MAVTRKFDLNHAKDIDELAYLAVTEQYADSLLYIIKFATNTDIDAAAVEDGWSAGGTLANLSSAETVDVVSSSASDAAAGVGARTIKIYGVDNDWNLINETITLNGITPVESVNSYLAIYRSFVVTSGSSNTNVGNISMTASTAATTQAYIAAAAGQTAMSHFPIPANYTGLITRILRSIYRGPGGSGSRAGEISFMVTDINGNQIKKHELGFASDGATTHEALLNLPLTIPEKTFVKCVSGVETNNTTVSIIYDLILIKNKMLDNGDLI